MKGALAVAKSSAELQRDIDIVMAGGAKSKIGWGGRGFKIATTDPKTMTPAQINREIDKLGERDSVLGQKMIDAGRGYERPSEYLRMEDPLSRELRTVSDRRAALRLEIEMRYGPGAPRRLPPGFKRRS